MFPSSGCPVQEGSLECRNPFRVFQGCMRLLTLDNQPVDLIKVQQRLLGNYSHLQIDMCGIIDRLVSRNAIWTAFFPTVKPPYPTGVWVWHRTGFCTRFVSLLLFLSFCLTCTFFSEFPLLCVLFWIKVSHYWIHEISDRNAYSLFDLIAPGLDHRK